MKKIPNKHLKRLYKIHKNHEWMKVLNDQDKNNIYFKIYKNQKKRLKNLLKYIKFNPKFNVVEFGCGNGLYGNLISQKVKSYIGVDFSEDFIYIAKERKKNLKVTNNQFECEDIIKFSKKHTNEFDQAFSIDFSEHIYDNDFISIFTAIKKTLKKNGELYIHTPNENYFLELLKKYKILKQTLGHVGVRNSKKYINLLKKIGFKKIVILYLPHYLKPFSSIHFLSYIPIIGKFFKARLLIKLTK